MATSFRRNLRHVLVPTLALSVAACGGGSDGDNNASSRMFTLAKNSITVTEQTVGAVDFTYSSDDVNDDGRSVTAVVRLPAGVGYIENTLEIDAIVEPDIGVDPVIISCDSGEIYLQATFDRDQLSRASNPRGDADATFKFTVVGLTAGVTGPIEVAVSKNGVPFTCGTDFASQDSETITVQ